MNEHHIPVMTAETLTGLQIKPDQWYADATFGRGGHTRLMLSEQAKVIAFDWDEAAIEYGREAFAQELADNRLLLVRESFSNLERIVKDLQKQGLVEELAGALFDFGTSTNQLMSSERGFSFEGDGPLDMRMDERLGVKASDILQAVPAQQLADMFFRYGGETHSRQIAQAIKKSKEPITTVQQLSTLIEKVKGGRRSRLHPATKVFQALRVVVNSELEEIESALPQALNLLKPGGRLVAIAFHEGEDRIAKTLFKNWDAAGKGTAFDLITPSNEEVKDNPRSRSAKLRIFEKKN